MLEKKLTCINILELLGIFISEVAIVLAYETEFKSKYKWQPTVEVRGNNLQANVWSGTKSMGNEKAHVITKLQCMLKMQTDIGFTHPHIKGIANTVADGFSRKEWEIFLASFTLYSPVELNLLKQENLDSWPLRLQQFRLSPETLSLMASAILSPSTIELPTGKPRKWGQICPKETISLNLCKK